MQSKWEILTCYRMEDSWDVIAEVVTKTYISESEMEKIIDKMLDMVNDTGEHDYEWWISPSVLWIAKPYGYKAILEIVLRETTHCGRASRPETGLDGDTVDSLRRQHRSVR